MPDGEDADNRLAADDEQNAIGASTSSVEKLPDFLPEDFGFRCKAATAGILAQRLDGAK
jgi:hypothetical protein